MYRRYLDKGKRDLYVFSGALVQSSTLDVSQYIYSKGVMYLVGYILYFSTITIDDKII